MISFGFLPQYQINWMSLDVNKDPILSLHKKSDSLWNCLLFTKHTYLNWRNRVYLLSKLYAMIYLTFYKYPLIFEIALIVFKSSAQTIYALRSCSILFANLFTIGILLTAPASKVWNLYQTLSHCSDLYSTLY